MTPPVYVADQGVRVCARKCDTCIFHPGNKMDLAPGRVKQMLKVCLEHDGGNIVCHSTLDWPAGAICRGFWDAYADRSVVLRMAKLMDAVVNIDPVDGSAS